MNNRVVVVACSILVLALIATGTDYKDQDQTADKEEGVTNPATTNPVDVRIAADCTNGSGIIIQNINSKFVKKDSTPFQVGATDSFQVRRECVKSKICSVYVQLNGEDDWIIEGMKVDIEEHEEFSSDYFNFASRKVSRNDYDGVDNCKCNAVLTDLGDGTRRSIFPTLGE
ncbi:hypothetical protein ACFE04_005885 [Oxalis oulophora]